MNAIVQNIDMAQASLRTIKPQTIEKPALKTASKQMETLFLNEVMRIMLEQTSIGQDKTISIFLPVITSEISKSMAERGIGIGEFLMKNTPDVQSGTESVK